MPALQSHTINFGGHNVNFHECLTATKNSSQLPNIRSHLTLFFNNYEHVAIFNVI